METPEKSNHSDERNVRLFNTMTDNEQNVINTMQVFSKADFTKESATRSISGILCKNYWTNFTRELENSPYIDHLFTL